MGLDSILPVVAATVAGAVKLGVFQASQNLHHVHSAQRVAIKTVAAKLLAPSALQATFNRMMEPTNVSLQVRVTLQQKVPPKRKHVLQDGILLLRQQHTVNAMDLARRGGTALMKELQGKTLVYGARLEGMERLGKMIQIALVPVLLDTFAGKVPVVSVARTHLNSVAALNIIVLKAAVQQVR